MNQEKIGLFIKELRIKKKLTQKDLAEKLNLTVQAVSKWERGKGLPDISYLEDLSNIFEISILEILKGERTTIINDNDIASTYKLGKKYEKEKILRPLNILLRISILLIIVIVLIFNISNIYFGKKQYNVSTPHITKERINNLLDKIEVIRNNQGIYSNEDYEEILNQVGTAKYFLLQLKKVDYDKPVTYKELLINNGSRYYEILGILVKYDPQFYDEYKEQPYWVAYFASAYSELSAKMLGNIYKYQIDITDYSSELIMVQENTLNFIEKVVNKVMEIGEINE